MGNRKQEPETFDIDSLPIGIEELAREEGEKIGLEKGEQIGLKKGEKKEKERIALNMLEKNMDIILIEEITGLDREYIQQLGNKS